MTQRSNFSLICYLFVCLFIKPHSLAAQSSLFEKDTVFFNNFSLGDKDEIMQKEIFEWNNSHWVDTLPDYKIILDLEGNVHWELNKSAGGFASYLWDLGLHDKGESVSDLKKKISETGRMQVPKFKVYKYEKGFQYKTVDIPKTILSVSFDKKDTLRTMPFFMGSSDGVQVRLDDLKLVFVQDTIIKIKDKMVPCYYFQSQKTSIRDHMQAFSLYHYDVYFEQASCLPVYIVSRTCFRTYYPNTGSGYTGYGTSYQSSFISIR